MDHSLLSHGFQPSDTAGSLDSEGTERFSKAMLFGEEVLAAFSSQPSKGYIWQVEQGEGIPKHPRHPFPPVSTSPFIPSDALIPYALTSSRVQYQSSLRFTDTYLLNSKCLDSSGNRRVLRGPIMSQEGKAG